MGVGVGAVARSKDSQDATYTRLSSLGHLSRAAATATAPDASMEQPSKLVSASRTHAGQTMQQQAADTMPPTAAEQNRGSDSERTPHADHNTTTKARARSYQAHSGLQCEGWRWGEGGREGGGKASNCP